MRISDWSSDVCSSDLIDLLINNAGLALADAPTPAAELNQWKTMIETNITGLVSLTHALLPGLIARRGAIINISSVAANYPYAAGHAYGGTKAFVRQFSLCLRSDLHGKGRSEEHTSELQSLMRTSYAVFCLKTYIKR